jgi:hypothetical protein
MTVRYTRFPDRWIKKYISRRPMHWSTDGTVRRSTLIFVTFLNLTTFTMCFHISCVLYPC